MPQMSQAKPIIMVYMLCKMRIAGKYAYDQETIDQYVVDYTVLNCLDKQSGFSIAQWRNIALLTIKELTTSHFLPTPFVRTDNRLHTTGSSINVPTL